MLLKILQDTITRLDSVISPMYDSLKTVANRGNPRPITNADIVQLLHRKISFDAIYISLGNLQNI